MYEKAYPCGAMPVDLYDFLYSWVIVTFKSGESIKGRIKYRDDIPSDWFPDIDDPFSLRTEDDRRINYSRQGCHTANPLDPLNIVSIELDLS